MNMAPMQTVEIVRANNGLILKIVDAELFCDDDEEGEDRESLYVYSSPEYDSTDAEECAAFADFLRLLVQDHGPACCNSRYAEARVYVDVRPGDKYETAHASDAEESKGAEQ